MAELEMWRLRSFLVVAEELHFGRASQRLNMTQPTLSRQIQALESRIGVPLLLRGPHGVALTDAGRELRIEGDRLLEQSARAVDRARRAARGDLGHVSVGFVGSAVHIVVESVATMKEKHPDVAFNLMERPYRDPTTGLLTGEDDLVLSRDVAADHDWQIIKLTEEQSYLVVPAFHPLAHRAGVTFEEVERLRDETFISTRRWMSVWGFQPHKLDEVASAQATLQLVNAGVGVSLMPGGYRSQAGGGLRFIPVEDMTSALQLALPRKTPSPATLELLKVLTVMFPSLRNAL